jgi:signal transduction histidine kinase
LLVEGLLAPFHVDGQAVGTVWVIAHDETRKFEAEDQRLLESLATFAAAAYQTRLSIAAQAKANQDLQAEVAERQRAEAALREADRRKSEFLGMLAHELRNPLAPIRNAVEILRRSGGDEQKVNSVTEMMQRQVGQMVRLIDDLLDVSRISRGEIELRREPVELASIVHHAVEAVRPLCESMNHDLTVTLPSQPAYLNADPSRLAQVVGNLLKNACKFTETDARGADRVGSGGGPPPLRGSRIRRPPDQAGGPRRPYEATGRFGLHRLASNTTEPIARRFARRRLPPWR